MPVAVATKSADRAALALAVEKYSGETIQATLIVTQEQAIS